MSTTEKEALAAGDIWWEGNLFQGRPDWGKLHSIPKPTLSQEELDFINHQVETLCGLIDDWKIAHIDKDLSPKAWAYLKQERFFGMIIPKKYGGLEFSALANSTIVQKIATKSLAAAITTMVPNSLGPAELLLAYGTEDQKNHYLPKLAIGEEIPCFALTGPEAGSDASAIPDVGIVARGEFQGKEILGMRLTWDKRYITLAPVATVLGLAFKLYDPDGLLGTEKSLGITVCLLPTHLPGIEIGKRHLPLDQYFMNGPTRGKDVFVPLDYIIGGPKMAGLGWRMLVECLSAGRGISLPAVSAAAAKVAYRSAGAYTRIRKQFKTSIGHFEGVEAVMARIAGYTYLLEATRLFVLSGIDQHVRPSIATAIAKYHMTEMSRIVVLDAMDIHGGKAIMLGPKNYLGRGYESLPISITVEGANILTRNLIIFGQGAIRCHPYIQLEINAATDKNMKEGLKKFDQVIVAHMGYTLSNTLRLIFHSLTGGLFCLAPKENHNFSDKYIDLKKYYRQIGRMSLALSVIADYTLMIFGGKLKRRERLSARLGDVLSYLFLASAVLKYYKDFGEKKTDKHHAEWALKMCLYRVQEAFLDFFRNFGSSFISYLLRELVFPFGRAYAMPRDSLDHKIAEGMMSPSNLRDRLTQHVYLGTNEEQPLANLEDALTQMIAVEPLLTKLDEAFKQSEMPKGLDLGMKLSLAQKKGILTEQEIRLIQQFELVRKKVIQVDEFSNGEL